MANTPPLPVRLAVFSGIGWPCPEWLPERLKGVARILIAGGIHHPQALAAFEALAPVTAVVGHKDFLAFGGRLPETAELEFAGAHLILAALTGAPEQLIPPLRRRMESQPPDVLVSGDGPRGRAVWLPGTLFFCPGPLSPTQPGLEPSWGILEIEGPGRVTAHLLRP